MDKIGDIGFIPIVKRKEVHILQVYDILYRYEDNDQIIINTNPRKDAKVLLWNHLRNVPHYNDVHTNDWGKNWKLRKQMNIVKNVKQRII